MQMNKNANINTFFKNQLLRTLHFAFHRVEKYCVQEGATNECKCKCNNTNTNTNAKKQCVKGGKLSCHLNAPKTYLLYCFGKN